MKSEKVICFGEALIDRLGPLGGDPLVDKPTEDCMGGAPANVACALGRLGNEVVFIGRLGDDLIGTNFRKLMKSRRLNISGLQSDKQRPSRVVLVNRDLDGERSFQGFLGDQGEGFADQALELNPLIEQWPLFVRNARWLIAGTIPLASPTSSEVFLWVLQQAEKGGLPIAIDVNWRATFWNSKSVPTSGPDELALRSITQILAKASLIKLAKEEAIWFFNNENPIEISKSLPQNPDVVITNGSRPIVWSINGFYGETKVLSPPSVVDTTGAGDAFTAGMIHKLSLLSESLDCQRKYEDIVRFAAACGACVCRGPGAIDPQPTYEEVQGFLASGGES